MMNRGGKMAEEIKDEELKNEDADTEETVDAAETEVVENPQKENEEKIAKLEEEVNTWKTDYYKVFADM